MIRKTGIAIVAAAVGLSTPAFADKVLKSTAIGAGAGALAGAVIPGVSVGTGALVGGAGGAIVGISNKNKHKHYYSQSGQSYWVDKHGRRHYR